MVADGVKSAIAWPLASTPASGQHAPAECADALEGQIQEPPDLRTVKQFTGWSRAPVRSRKLVDAGGERARAACGSVHPNVMAPAEPDGVHTDRVWLERRPGRRFVTVPGRTLFVTTGIREPGWTTRR